MFTHIDMCMCVCFACAMCTFMIVDCKLVCYCMFNVEADIRNILQAVLDKYLQAIS